jgi:hypothetical protein
VIVEYVCVWCFVVLFCGVICCGWDYGLVLVCVSLMCLW